MLSIVALSLIGCSADCENPGRMDGNYAAFSTVGLSDPSGQNLEGYPTSDGWAPDSFFNGWSDWSLKYVPGEKSFDMLINEQPFTAIYQQDDLDCNAFSLAIDGGLWEGTTNDSSHVVSWRGDLRFTGEKISGTFAYSDTWSVPADGSSGTIEVAQGEVTATTGKAGDTGF